MSTKPANSTRLFISLITQSVFAADKELIVSSGLLQIPYQIAQITIVPCTQLYQQQTSGRNHTPRDNYKSQGRRVLIIAKLQNKLCVLMGYWDINSCAIVIIGAQRWSWSFQTQRSNLSSLPTTTPSTLCSSILAHTLQLIQYTQQFNIQCNSLLPPINLLTNYYVKGR